MATTASTTKPAPSGLAAVLGFAFINSLGTGAVTNGIYFLTKEAYGFSRAENYALGVLLGGVYIAGAFGVGPLLTLLTRRSATLTSRRAVAAIMLCLVAACFLPRVAAAAAGSEQPPIWSIWVLVGVYGPLTGALWPIVESYLGGGRRQAALRRATGLFNILWASAVAVSFWIMAPLFELGRPLDVIVVLGLSHLASLAWLARFRPEPARHLDDGHEPHPPVYRDLLVVFRWLLPTSYVVMSTLTPFLPDAFQRLGVGSAAAAVMASTWMFTRVFVFIGFERWHGWHGRWWPAVVALIGLSGSLAAVLASPRFGEAGVPLLLVALAGFGASQGLIYLGALYYAMEVGAAEVDAGGMHEALIGVGYTLGPLSGLVVGLLLGPAHPQFEGTLLLVVLGIAVLSCLVAAKQVARRSGPLSREAFAKR